AARCERYRNVRPTSRENAASSITPPRNGMEIIAGTKAPATQASWNATSYRTNTRPQTPPGASRCIRLWKASRPISVAPPASSANRARLGSPYVEEGKTAAAPARTDEDGTASPPNRRGLGSRRFRSADIAYVAADR